jgi:hypothetical protein
LSGENTGFANLPKLVKAGFGGGRVGLLLAVVVQLARCEGQTEHSG